MPKKYQLPLPGVRRDEEYIKSEDIFQEKELDLLNRKFKILGCDKFTQDYYQEKMGRRFTLYQASDKETNRRADI